MQHEGLTRRLFRENLVQPSDCRRILGSDHLPILQGWPECAEFLPSAENSGLQFLLSKAGLWKPTGEVRTPRASRHWTAFGVSALLEPWHVGNTGDAPLTPVLRTNSAGDSPRGTKKCLLNQSLALSFWVGGSKKEEQEDYLSILVLVLRNMFLKYKIQKGLQWK